MRKQSKLGKNLVEQLRKALQLQGFHPSSDIYKKEIEKAEIKVERAREVAKKWYQSNKEKKKAYREQCRANDPLFKMKQAAAVARWRKKNRLEKAEQIAMKYKMTVADLKRKRREEAWSPSYRARKKRLAVTNEMLARHQFNMQEHLFSNYPMLRNLGIYWHRKFIEDTYSEECHGNPYLLFPRRQPPINFNPAELDAPLDPDNVVMRCPQITMINEQKRARGQFTGYLSKRRPEHL